MTNSKRDLRSLAPVLLLVLMAGLSVGAFFFLFEQVEEEVDGQPRGQAARNPWFAAERMLTDLGVPTISRYGLGPLPPYDHVVVILTDDDAQRGPLTDRLTSWVIGGGHLLVVPARARQDHGLFDFFVQDGEFSEYDPPNDEESTVVGDQDQDWANPVPKRADDPVESEGDFAADALDTGPGSAFADEADPDALLDAFGVSIGERWRGDAGLRIEVDSPSRDGSRSLRLDQVPQDFRWWETDSELANIDDIDIWPAFSARVDSELYGAMRRRVGAGQLTVMPEAGFLKNDHIDKLDHAVFLVDMVSRAGALPRGAVLVLSGDAPSITGLMWRAGWPGIVSLAFLFIAWAWRATVRFGPPLPVAAPARRSLLEHVEASGHFLWRHGLHGQPLASARSRLRARLVRRHPNMAKLDDDALAEAIAARLDMLPEDARAALIGGEGSDRRTFLTAVRALQRAWRRA